MMADPAQDTAQPSPAEQAAERLDAMSKACSLNKGDTFSGAIVIIPPGDGQPVELLLLDNLQNPALFWGTVKSYVDAAIADLEEQERQGGGARGLGWQSGGRR